MELKEMFKAYEEATEPTDAFILIKSMIEILEANADLLKPEIEALPIGDYLNEDVGKKLSVIEMQKASINAKAVEELSEEEIRKTYKLTEKALKDLKRKDLIEKYKTTSTVRQVRVTKIDA